MVTNKHGYLEAQGTSWIKESEHHNFEAFILSQIISSLRILLGISTPCLFTPHTQAPSSGWVIEFQVPLRAGISILSIPESMVLLNLYSECSAPWLFSVVLDQSQLRDTPFLVHLEPSLGYPVILPSLSTIPFLADTQVGVYIWFDLTLGHPFR